jgi:6-pyruvoyltetrahydropterin/6-carboxytetrahydropterin synthase
MYRVTKTYGHNLGLSATFRQWRAESHCHFMHGYALAVTLMFACEELNANNWVIDFGSLKPVKKWLEDNFDHKTLVAQDDPELEVVRSLAEGNLNTSGDNSISGAYPLFDVVIVPDTGCEAFARFIADNTINILNNNPLQGGVSKGLCLESVEVREHGANSAIYYPGERGILQ